MKIIWKLFLHTKRKKKEQIGWKKYETFDRDIGEIPSPAYHRSTENNRIKRWCPHSRWPVNKLLCNQSLYPIMRSANLDNVSNTSWRASIITVLPFFFFLLLLLFETKGIYIHEKRYSICSFHVNSLLRVCSTENYYPFPLFSFRVKSCLDCPESFHHEDHGPLWNSGYIIFRLPCDSHRGRVNCRFNRCVSFRNRLARSTIRNNYSFEGIHIHKRVGWNCFLR